MCVATRSDTYMITFPPVCSEGPLFDVELAVVWRGLQVDQVGVGVGLETLEFGHQHPPTPLLFLMNLMSAVELVLQNLPDLQWPKDIVVIGTQ